MAKLQFKMFYYVLISYLKFVRAAGSTQKVHARADLTFPATQEAVEDERMVSMLPVTVPAIAIDELADQLTVDVGTIVLPAIPINELKEITYNFSPQHLICRQFSQNVYHGTLQSGQLAAIKRLKNDRLPEPKFIAQVRPNRYIG